MLPDKKYLFLKIHGIFLRSPNGSVVFSLSGEFFF